MRIHIEDLTFDCIIGLLDFERDTTQKVMVNLYADYNYTKDNFVCYALIAESIQQNMISGKYELLETAIENITNQITSDYPSITKLKIQINKPSIISNCDVGISSLWTQ